jgi:hypothetical protein
MTVDNGGGKVQLSLDSPMETDGGWPLHVDAAGEDGHGTLLVAFSGWRRWVRQIKPEQP